jgi:hypothetical protein
VLRPTETIHYLSQFHQQTSLTVLQNLLTNPFLIQVLTDNCPVLFDWLKQPHIRVNGKLNELLIPLLQRICLICSKPGQELQIPYACQTSDAWSASDDWLCGQFWSSIFKIQRELPVFHADGNKNMDEENCHVKEVLCERIKKTWKNMSPGLLTCFCCHDICHGMQLLFEPESVKHVFQVFFMRHHCAPKIIHYDRAC